MFRSEGVCAVYEEATGPSGVRTRERPVTPPDPGHVSIAMRAASLNHLDLWLAQGAQRVEPPRVIAADGAGVVLESTDPNWKSGDEVVIYPVICDWTCPDCRAGRQTRCAGFGITGEHADGAACEVWHVPAANLYPKPPALTWEEAAAFPLTFLTAYRMLVTRARLQPGETVLVLGAGAGVAVAAISIAAGMGARVLATSRSEAKREAAMKLGVERAFATEGFARAAREATDGRGPDVVFEHIGPATLDESLKAVAMDGRIVTCGSTSGARAEIMVPRLFFKQATLLGSTMGDTSEFEAVLGLMAAGMRPVVDRVMPLTEVAGALSHLEQQDQFGKVVLRVS